MTNLSIEEQAYLENSSAPSLIKSRLTLGERTLRWLIPVAVFLAALLPRILSLDSFITADEDDQIMFATHFLNSVLRGDFGGALVLGYPGVPTLILGAGGVALRYLFHYSGWYPLPWVTADFFTTLNQVTTEFGKFDYPLDFLVWLRAPLALVAALSILGIYLFTKRLVNQPVALIAALLLAFDPFILAHSRVIHVDAPMSYFMFLSFLGFLLYLEDNGTWKWLFLSGLFGGLAGLSKTPAGILGPILVTSGIVYALLPSPELPRFVRWKQLFIALVVWGLIAVAAIFILWPSMWSRPFFAIQWVIDNIFSVNSGKHPSTGIFWNDIQSDQNPYYYLIVFPFHLTPLTTIGMILGVAMALTGVFHKIKKLNTWTSDTLPLLVALVTYIIVFIGPVSIISRRGDRYILPVYFAVGLISALALWWAARGLAHRLPTLMRRLKLTPARLVGGLLVLQTISVLLYHPYYLAYFNPVIGGPWVAPRFINIGWGEGLDKAAGHLNTITAKDTRTAAWYSAQFKPYYRGQTIDLSNQQAALTADYTVFYINQVQRGFPSKEILNYFRQRDPAHTVYLGGIEYAWVYEGPVIGQKAAQNFAFPVEALLGGSARLYGVDVPATEFPADAYAAPKAEKVEQTGNYLAYQQKLEGLPVTLYWETLGHIESNHGKLNVFVRLVDEYGNKWGQVDRLILAGMWRTNRWRAGYFLRDEYKLPIDPATPPGKYHLEIGLYDFETSLNYGVVKNVGEITLTPPEKLPEIEQLDIQTPINRAVNNSLNFMGHNYVDAQRPPGAEIAGKIFWQATGSLDTDYNLEFSFLGPDKKQYIINEGQLLSPTWPMTGWRKSEVVGQAYRFRVPAVAPPGDYTMQVTVTNPDTGQTIGKPVTLAQITVEALERNFDLPENVVPISAILDDQIELVGYKLHTDTVRARQTFGLTLYWRSLDFADSNYTVFVHVVDPEQGIRGQWDSVPVQGTSPTGGWIPGEIIEDHFDVLMGRDVPPWKYDIFAGMYDPVTGQRLPLFSPNAPTSQGRVWLTRIQGVEK